MGWEEMVLPLDCHTERAARMTLLVRESENRTQSKTCRCNRQITAGNNREYQIETLSRAQNCRMYYPAISTASWWDCELRWMTWSFKPTHAKDLLKQPPPFYPMVMVTVYFITFRLLREWWWSRERALKHLLCMHPIFPFYNPTLTFPAHLRCSSGDLSIFILVFWYLGIIFRFPGVGNEKDCLPMSLLYRASVHKACLPLGLL